ncbi:hypothetical protein ACJMK2_023903 [Sinanodonta woodiana]|uniref:CBF1-interacting co-repressor CIR N-terminal domain-containing protein n=1 Tax=Sinanodonta woodiana TaxID=1069815 RepID=A0ABD3T705_SINWO
MGKGFNNYMTKKFFHPASKENIKRVWMAEQKAAYNKKKQEDLLAQYQKEQEMYGNRALLGDEKAKMGLSFMYDAPPGMKKEKEKEEGEPEYKFEWQRKYNAPREAYAKNDDAIQDQPFGIEVRNVRCIKCRKWGHVNTDKTCPLFGKDLTAEPPQPKSSASSLLEAMREDGFTIKQSVLGKMSDPAAANEQLLENEDEEDPEVQFLKSLTPKQKKKLLKKLNKLQNQHDSGKKDKKKKKKKSKKHEESRKKKKDKKRKDQISEKESSDSENGGAKAKKMKRSRSESYSTNDSDTDTESDEKDQRQMKQKRSNRNPAILDREDSRRNDRTGGLRDKHSDEYQRDLRNWGERDVRSDHERKSRKSEKHLRALSSDESCSEEDGKRKLSIQRRSRDISPHTRHDSFLSREKVEGTFEKSKKDTKSRSHEWKTEIKEERDYERHRDRHSMSGSHERPVKEERADSVRYGGRREHERRSPAKIRNRDRSRSPRARRSRSRS